MSNMIGDDRCDDGYYFTSEFNFEKIKEQLKAHFDDDGAASQVSIASAISVKQQTLSAWLNQNSQYYRCELADLVLYYRDKVAREIAKNLNRHGRGKISGDGKVLDDLNRRANHRRKRLPIGLTLAKKIDHYNEQFDAGNMTVSEYNAVMKPLTDFETQRLVGEVARLVDEVNKNKQKS